jgi:formylglycine-generating enzyme required for sulfatase activity
VGSYTGSGSPWGTFDQGGNVWEWSEAVSESGEGREIRGGEFRGSPFAMGVGFRLSDVPTNETGVEGFRLVMIPEPGTGLLVTVGLLGLAGFRRAASRR